MKQTPLIFLLLVLLTACAAPTPSSTATVTASRMAPPVPGATDAATNTPIPTFTPTPPPVEFSQLASETMGCLKNDMCLGLEAKDGAALYTQFLDALAHSYENKQWMGNIKDAEQLRAFLKTSMHPDPVTGEMRPYWMPFERNGVNLKLLRGNKKGSYGASVFLDNNPGIEAAGGFFLDDIAFVAASKKEIDANVGGIADWLQKVEAQNGRYVLMQPGSRSEEVWGFAVVDGQAVFIAFNKNAPLDDFDHPENLLGQADAAANGRILSAMYELYTRVYHEYGNDYPTNPQNTSNYKLEPDSSRWRSAAMCVEGNGIRCDAHSPSYFGGDDALFIPVQE